MTDDPTLPFSHLPPPPPATPGPGPARVRTTPAVRGAWLVLGSVAATVGLLYSTFQVAGIIAHEEHDETVRIADPAVAVLDVGSDGGSIEIIGADVEDVRIEARVSDGLVPTRFTQDVVGDRLQVRVRCRLAIENQWCRADLRIVIPRDLEVAVRSSEDSIALRGLSGRVDAESGNGSVEAESLSGSTRLHSSNGSVRAARLRTESLQADSDNGSVRVEFATPPRSAIARSTNGSVDVAVPRGVERYAVDVASENGSTRNLVRSDPESDRRIVATTSNGSVTVRYLD
jgi:hypothetical protein